ncbi:unnamed protein product [Ceratitis capitata]|uniref:(Mediterranean fruit fly) hypothetical protein n=1 Tax=Ceratitis capitata TaxID=7213 RepID=A0A811UQ42_CERCA|nr:unnamed protein product [Ceratitis capitata]
MDCRAMLGLHFRSTCVELQCNNKKKYNNKEVRRKGAGNPVITTFYINNIGKGFAHKKLEARTYLRNYKLRKLQPAIYSVSSVESINSTNICDTNLACGSSKSKLYSSSVTISARNLPLIKSSLPSYLITSTTSPINMASSVILLDTTREATLEWTRYPYGPQAQTPGWVEESFTDFVKGINWRSYVVCDVAYNNVNNWLWSPFIDRGPANRLYIEIQFTIRDCSLFPGNALSCKETFSLLFYEFDAATREPPPWQTDSYKLIARIAAGEGRFNQNSDVDINTEVKSIAVTKKGVYFAFRDQGACISVLAVKVYYITCPAVTENFAHFNETPTGREITIIEKQNGTCVENAEPYETPTYLCKGDGKWTILTGGCHCKVGYEPDLINKTCNGNILFKR